MADLVERELQQPRPLAEIVAGVTDPAQRATLYNLAFAVVRADEQVGGAERIYLAQLANLLGWTRRRCSSSRRRRARRSTPLPKQ